MVSLHLAGWTPFDREIRHERAPYYYKDDILIDQSSGIEIPKNVHANLEWRIRVIRRATRDLGYRRFIMESSARSLVLACNLWMWTKTFKDVLPNGTAVATKWRDRPFVTWPVQDRILCEIEDARRLGENIAITKSRETGLSWLACVAGACGVLFEEESTFLYVSRKQEYVYKKGSNRALFTKILYNLLHKSMPEWLCGGIQEKELFIRNDLNGATIDGESTNENVGRGDRQDQAFIDESAAIANRREIDSAIDDCATSVVDISTPYMGSWFNEVVAKRLVRVSELPWFECADKSIGLRHDDDSPSGMTSNWREHQIVRKKGDMVNIAQNVDMELGRAGNLVFNPDVIRAHINRHAVRPLFRGEFVFAKHAGGETIKPEYLVEADERLRLRDPTSIRFDVSGRGIDRPRRRERWGEWSIWCEFEECPFTGMMRPPQDRLYIFGVDPGGGQGRNPCAAVVFDAMERRVIATWTNTDYGPKDQARVVIAAAIFFGGERTPILAHEVNGCGGAMTDTCVNLKYPSLFRRKPTDRQSAKKVPQYGFHNDDKVKPMILQNFGDTLSLANPSETLIVVPSRELLENAQTFVRVEDDGTVCPQAIAGRKKRDRVDHGDLTVAASIGAHALRDVPRMMSDTESQRMRKARHNIHTQAGREYREKRDQINRERRKRWAP